MGEIVAVNPAVVAPYGTVTDAGTAITTLPLDRLTLNPPLGAAELSVTVQASVAAPVTGELAQERALNVAAEVTFAVTAVLVSFPYTTLFPPQPEKARVRQEKNMMGRTACQVLKLRIWTRLRVRCCFDGE
jgi:hypothetical protein